MNIELRGIEVSINWLMSPKEFSGVKGMDEQGKIRGIEGIKLYMGFIDSEIWYR